MNKPILEQFINKYYLNGAVDVALWKSNGTELSTHVATPYHDLIAFITAKNIIIDQGKFPVIDTGQLLHMLGAVSDDIAWSVQFRNEKPTSFTFKDSKTTITKVLAYEGVIPSINGLKSDEINYEIEFILDSDFVNTFLKAKSALSDSTSIVFKSNGDTLQAIVGYQEDINTNRIAIDVATVKNDTLLPVPFNIDWFRAILMANKDSTKGTVSICSRGLCHVNFEVPDFAIDYYLLEMKTS